MGDRYEEGYRDGELNREADIIVAIEYAINLDELLTQLRYITNNPNVKLGSQWE